LQLDFLSEALKQIFTEVDQAENGFVAFTKVKSAERSYYDLIILDVNMPIMDGVEAGLRMKEHLKNSLLSDIVNFGPHIPLREKILKASNIDPVPVLIALTQDVQFDIRGSAFKFVLSSIDTR
jgi:CheY-like chemotaxis protein